MKQTGRQYIELKHLGWLSLIIGSTLAGLASIFINPLYMIVAVVAIVNVLLIVRYPMWGLLLYVMIYLLRFGEMYPMLAPLRVELLTGTAVLLAIVIQQKYLYGTINLPRDRTTFLLLGFLGAMCLSLFTSYEKTATVDMCIAFVKLLVFFYLIVSVITTKKRFILFVTWLVGIISYIAVDAFKAYLSGQFIHTMNVDRLTGSISSAGDPNSLGATLVLTTPLIVALMMYYKNYIAKAWFGFLAIFMVVLMTLTASRSGLLAFFAILGVAIAYSKHRVLYVALAIIMAVSGWFMLPEQYQNRYMKFSEVGEDIDDVSSGRWEIWISGVHMIIARPLTGVGAGAFAWANDSGEYGDPQWMQSHNLYIEVFATTGIIGFTIYFLFVGSLVQRLFGLARARYPDELKWIIPFAKSFVVIIIGLLVSGMFGHNSYRYTWYMLAGLSLSLMHIINVYSANHPETDKTAIEDQSKIVSVEINE